MFSLQKKKKNYQIKLVNVKHLKMFLNLQLRSQVIINKKKKKKNLDQQSQKVVNIKKDNSDEEDAEELTSNQIDIDEVEQDQEEVAKSGDEKSEDGEDKANTNIAGHAAEGGVNQDQNLKSATDQYSASSLFEDLIDHNAKQSVFTDLPSKILMDRLILKHKDVYKELTDTYWNKKDLDSSEIKFKEYMDSKIVQLYNDNKKVIQYMVKEFEMKKSADQYKRASVSKTGTLDMNKIHTYKFNDDLFAKMTTVPNATNHGMVMLLDCGLGSMAYNMTDTLKQLFNLIWFAKELKFHIKYLHFQM